MILNDIERAVICGKQEYRTNADFIDAIEAAVLAKLAQGVSVEPVATVLQTRRMQALGDACGVEAHLHHYQPPGTPLYTATAIAAARVKALEDAAVIAEHENAADWSVSGQIARRVRALKDGLEAAQAEIEAQQHRIQSLWMERDAALARIAKLEPKRNVSPPSEELVLHKMRYHFWEAEDDEPADFELFDAGVECDTCIDVALVRQDRLDELIAAAGASPVQPSQDLSLDLLERLSKTLTRLGYATPEGGMEHFNADLENQLYNLCRAVDNIFDRVQPSQAGELSDTERLDFLDENKGSNVFSIVNNWYTGPGYGQQRKTTRSLRDAVDAAINAKESGK